MAVAVAVAVVIHVPHKSAPGPVASMCPSHESHMGHAQLGVYNSMGALPVIRRGD